MNMIRPLISDGEVLVGFITYRNFPATHQLVDMKIKGFCYQILAPKCQGLIGLHCDFCVRRIWQGNGIYDFLRSAHMLMSEVLGECEIKSTWCKIGSCIHFDVPHHRWWLSISVYWETISLGVILTFAQSRHRRHGGCCNTLITGDM